MNAHSPSAERDRYRVVGEDTPPWLSWGFALAGTLIATAAAWLLVAPPPSAPTSEPSQPATASLNPPSPPSAETPIMQPAATASEPRAGGGPPVPASVAPTPVTTAESPSAERVSAAPAPAAAPVSAQPHECPPVAEILFQRGSARLPPSGNTSLEPLQTWLRDHPEARLTVAGFASPFGGAKSNLILSYRRAQTVADVLQKAGVELGRLDVRAAGEQASSGPNATEASQRRVSLTVVNGDKCRAASAVGKRR